jgi:predicted transcriptional regulator
MTSHTDENCATAEGLIREDQRVKVRQIAEVTGLSKSTVHEIISDLKFHIVSACWVLKMLTKEHKSSMTSHFSPDSWLVPRAKVGNPAA